MKIAETTATIMKGVASPATLGGMGGEVDVVVMSGIRMLGRGGVEGVRIVEREGDVVSVGRVETEGDVVCIRVMGRRDVGGMEREDVIGIRVVRREGGVVVEMVGGEVDVVVGMVREEGVAMGAVVVVESIASPCGGKRESSIAKAHIIYTDEKIITLILYGVKQSLKGHLKEAACKKKLSMKILCPEVQYHLVCIHYVYTVDSKSITDSMTVLATYMHHTYLY